MAEAKPKYSAAAQRSKRHPPKQEELGTRSDFEARAWQQEWKQRLYDLIDTHYSTTPLQKRQWWKVRDIADEHARIRGITGIDHEKHDRMVNFFCRAICQGEFKDGNGRMQVANLHPSPHSPFRLDVKWLVFDQLLRLAFNGYLFVRRKECIECFSRHNIDVPPAWLPSELTAYKTPPAKECWKIIEPRPSQREPWRALTVIRQIWRGGPPLSMSIRAIVEKINEAPNKAGGFSETSVRRVLKR